MGNGAALRRQCSRPSSTLQSTLRRYALSLASRLRNRPRRPQQQREQETAHVGIGCAFDAGAGQRVQVALNAWNVHNCGLIDSEGKRRRRSGEWRPWAPPACSLPPRVLSPRCWASQPFGVAHRSAIAPCDRRRRHSQRKSLLANDLPHSPSDFRLTI
jgi:hypothetical protein